MQSILIIEDEPELARVVRSYLEKAGFAVSAATRGDMGLRLWEQNQPDLVLLDLNLPGMDGLDVARAIRRKANTPIIMLTARVEEADRLIGLELGADDYITKPFSPREVVARVRAVLRRSSASVALPQTIKVGELEIDLESHTVFRGEESLALTPTEFSYLVLLSSQPGRVFKRDQLLEASQGVAFEGYERTVDAHIKNLRAKVERNPKKPKLIETVFGIGYRLKKD
ncbi:MAG: response regulator transcription factor [Chloroflexi bacterium]|nr:response regulator transcription factor [Chloroflexota bacterium]